MLRWNWSRSLSSERLNSLYEIHIPQRCATSRNRDERDRFPSPRSHRASCNIFALLRQQLRLEVRPAQASWPVLFLYSEHDNRFGTASARSRAREQGHRRHAGDATGASNAPGTHQDVVHPKRQEHAETNSEASVRHRTSGATSAGGGRPIPRHITRNQDCQRKEVRETQHIKIGFVDRMIILIIHFGIKVQK